jgi:hypothetical protein
LPADKRVCNDCIVSVEAGMFWGDIDSEYKYYHYQMEGYKHRPATEEEINDVVRSTLEQAIGYGWARYGRKLNCRTTNKRLREYAAYNIQKKKIRGYAP